MLESKVIEAVKNGRFHIWAVDHVDQGIELLTGVPAGERNEQGEYPEGTINYLVDMRLEDLSRGMKEFEAGPEEEEKSSDEEAAS
jgi:predicted ATP-dependent protease